jgi:hypothetical protein
MSKFKIKFNLYIEKLGNNVSFTKKLKNLPRKGDLFKYDDVINDIIYQYFKSYGKDYDVSHLIISRLIDTRIHDKNTRSNDDLEKDQYFYRAINNLIKDIPTASLIHSDTLIVDEILFSKNEIHVTLKEDLES